MKEANFRGIHLILTTCYSRKREKIMGTVKRSVITRVLGVYEECNSGACKMFRTMELLCMRSSKGKGCHCTFV